MMLMRALESRGPAFILAFVGGCVLSSGWLFGMVELVWSGIAVRRWYQVRDEPRGRRIG